MVMSPLDLKRVYYYVIAVMAFFVLMWGVVDLASSSIGLYNLSSAAPGFSAPAEESPMMLEKGEQLFDTFYQTKMLHDRFWDSVARLVIGGLIFAYCRLTINRLEKQS